MPRLHMQGSMRGLMTISVSDERASRLRRPMNRALVIISLLLAAVAQAANPSLTTSAPAAPLLTTVVINGSTVYGPPQLFNAYRDQLGQPISRDSARAVVDAIVALYERNGYVRPELTLDDSADRPRHAARAGVRAADHARELRR